MVIDCTMTVNGKQVKATVDEREMKEAMYGKKTTGYEYADGNEASCYFYVDDIGRCMWGAHNSCYSIAHGEQMYGIGNYYTNENVAKNNARADALMRKLRQFAAEHGGCVAGKRKTLGAGYIIEMLGPELRIRELWAYGILGSVAFSTYEAAKEAIEVFRDDLLWYFTEYDPMPEGWQGE